MTTILHITRMNFLSNKAHVYTTTKTCEALAMQENTKVILLSSDNSLISNDAKDSFFKKHDILKRFDIVSLNSFSNKLKGSKIRPVNWMETISVNISILNYVLFNSKKFDILYYRDCSLILPILASKYILSKPIFIELHAVLHKKHGQFSINFFSKISNGLITISYSLKEYYKKINSKIMVAFCAAAEPERFALIKESNGELRNILNLPKDKTILMYSGNLYKTGNYDSYGIEDIVNAMPFVSNSFVFVGVGKKGNETKEHEELALRLGIQNKIIFLPWVSKQKVYEYWKASDMLLLPAAGAQIGNSPTKMFEYLAAEKPIISARTKAIEEVLEDKKNALLISNYKDPQEWARAIESMASDVVLRDNLIKQAMLDSKRYTWENRGLEILKFINKSL